MNLSSQHTESYNYSSTNTETMTAEAAPAHNALKRRQSDIADEEEGSKRQRTTPGKDSPQRPTAADSENPDSSEASKKKDSPQDTAGKAAGDRRGSDTRRKSSVIDERQRSKRLFGGLLGNLAQPGNTVSKRRQEIEARRKAELQRQDDERVEDKQKRVEQSAVRRRQIKRRFDEQAVGLGKVRLGRVGWLADDGRQMRVRHEQELRNARFLQTKVEPKLVSCGRVLGGRWAKLI